MRKQLISFAQVIKFSWNIKLKGGGLTSTLPLRMPLLHCFVIQATASHISAVMIPSCRSKALTVAIRTMTVIVRWTATQREKMFLLKFTCRLYLAKVMQCRLNVFWDHDVTLSSLCNRQQAWLEIVHCWNSNRNLYLICNTRNKSDFHAGTRTRGNVHETQSSRMEFESR